jgi:copper chaperone CopZ
MNKLILLASLLFITASCAKQEQQHTSDANVQTTAIAIPTVQCSMCTETITDALKEVDGVQSVDADLEKKVATVAYLPAVVDVSRLEQAIANAGYDANATKRNAEAYEKLPECCKEPFL